MFSPQEKVIARNRVENVLSNQKGVLFQIFKKHLAKLMLELLETLWPDLLKRFVELGVKQENEKLFGKG